MKNRAAFESRYGFDLPIIGEYSEIMDNSGARIVLASPLGDTISDVSYRDDWQPITDGAYARVSDENIATHFSSDSIAMESEQRGEWNSPAGLILFHSSFLASE